jgi:acetoin utilization deacetylase AcuC-like enzyme
MLVFHSPFAVRHDTQNYFRRGAEVRHPESVERYVTLRDAALRAGHTFTQAGDHGIKPLLAVHDAGYLRFLEQAWDMARAIDPTIEEIVPTDFARGIIKRRPTGLAGLVSYHSADTSSCIRPGTWSAVYGAAQSAISAADALTDNRAAYALSRPPGHHAGSDYSSGFCFLNNAAIAAERLCGRLGKVALLDIDVHHGDGTQALFYDRGDVLTVSIHAETSDFFPFFTGDAEETGTGAGAGCNLNIPLDHGVGDQPYLDAIEQGLDRVRAHGAEVLVVSLGLDAAADDPMGALNVTSDGFRRAADLIASADLPTLLVQEGGYPCEALGRNLVAFLSGFEMRAGKMGANRTGTRSHLETLETGR